MGTSGSAEPNSLHMALENRAKSQSGRTTGPLRAASACPDFSPPQTCWRKRSSGHLHGVGFADHVRQKVQLLVIFKEGCQVIRAYIFSYGANECVYVRTRMLV